jgi:hypothetical protein
MIIFIVPTIIIFYPFVAELASEVPISIFPPVQRCPGLNSTIYQIQIDKYLAFWIKKGSITEEDLNVPSNRYLSEITFKNGQFNPEMDIFRRAGL